MEEQWEPQWIPYSTPPQSWRERVRHAVERYFPVVLGLALLALGGVLFFSLSERGGAALDREELEALARTQRENVAVEAEPYTGQAVLSVTTQPSGATVLVDQDTVGVTPLEEYELPAGVYLLSVRKENYAAVDTVVALRRDQAPMLAMALDQRRGGFEAEQEEEPPPTPPDAEREALAEERTRPPVTAEDEAPPEPSAAQEAAVGSVRLTSEPAGASVWLDGEEVGETPVVVRGLPAGPHTALFRIEGYEDYSASVSVQPQQASEAHATLEPRFGTLRVLALPWGSIYINGTVRKQNTDVWYTTQLPPGRHEITVVHPSLGRHEQTVQVEGGQEQSVVVNLAPSSGGAGEEGGELAKTDSSEEQN